MERVGGFGVICILTEKPSAAKNFAKALGGTEGEYGGEKYRIVNSVGHIMAFPDGPEQMLEDTSLQNRYHSWKPEYLPWKEGDLRWRRCLDEDKKDVYSEIKFWTSVADEVVIATDDDPSGEGTLLAAEILLTLDLNGKKLSRMFFEDEAEKSIQRAFEGRVPIPDLEKDKDYIKADFRSKWDYLSMQFTRIASACSPSGGVLRNGRLKSFMNVLVGDQLKAVEDYKKIPSYQQAFRDGNGHWFTDRKSELYGRKEDVPVIPGMDFQVVIDSREKKSSPPPKLIDLAGLSARLAAKGIKAKDTLAVYQKMYEKQVVSYPRTEDKEITPEQFGELLPHVDEIARLTGADTSLLTHRDPRPTHVKAGGAHGANRPGPNIPASLENVEKEFSFIGREIYTLLAKSFLAMFAEDYIYEQVKAHIDGHESFRGQTEKPLSGGYRLIWAEDKEPEEEGEEDSGKDFTEHAEFEVKESFPKRPAQPTMKWLMKNLEKYNVGTGATRTSTYAEVTGTAGKYPLMADEKGKITLTPFGQVNWILLKGTNIGGHQLTEKLQSDMKKIGTGEITDIKPLLDDMERYVTEDLEVMKKNAGDISPDVAASAVPGVLGTCPHCGAEVKWGEKFKNAYCTGKCGMTFRYYGKPFTEQQVRYLLSGLPVTLKGLTSKAGKKYDLTLKPAGVSSYTYAGRDGSIVTGFQYEFETSFPKAGRKKDSSPKSRYTW